MTSISTWERGLRTGSHSHFPKTQQGQQFPTPLQTFTENPLIKSPFCITIAGHFDEKTLPVAFTDTNWDTDTIRNTNTDTNTNTGTKKDTNTDTKVNLMTYLATASAPTLL